VPFSKGREPSAVGTIEGGIIGEAFRVVADRLWLGKLALHDLGGLQQGDGAFEFGGLASDGLD
jgi:hypothetical protein